MYSQLYFACSWDQKDLSFNWNWMWTSSIVDHTIYTSMGLDAYVYSDNVTLCVFDSVEIETIPYR